MTSELKFCPNCGGYADNGFDRCRPPNPYFCTKCENEHGEIEMTHDMPETINVVKHPKSLPKYPQLTVLFSSEVCMNQTPYIRADKYEALQAKCDAYERALYFYRNGFTPKHGKYGIEWEPSEVLLEDCGNRAKEALAEAEKVSGK